MQKGVTIGRIFLAAMFVFSAVSKMLSLPFFDGLVAELLIGEDYYNHPQPLFYTQILTRVLIGFELILGVAVLQKFAFKKIVLPGIMAMLVLFTVHLIYEGLTSPKGFIEGNCGCFGDILPMNNLESVIKNVVAMLVGVFVWLKYKAKEDNIPSWAAVTVLGLITIATLLATVKSYETSENELIEEEVTEFEETLSSDTLSQIKDDGKSTDSTTNSQKTEPNTKEIGKADDGNKSQGQDSDLPPVQKEPVSSTMKMLSKLPPLSDGNKLNLKTGKTLVCMFSMTCGHCQEIYKELCKTKDQAGWPNIALINFGKDFEQKYFFNQAGGCEHPHLRTEDYVKFNKWLEGEGFPRILAVENGKIVQSWNIDSYSNKKLFDYYGIKEKEASTPDGGIKLKPKTDDGLQGKNPWD